MAQISAKLVLIALGDGGEASHQFAKKQVNVGRNIFK
jgi:hypothetical protein